MSGHLPISSQCIPISALLDKTKSKIRAYKAIDSIHKAPFNISTSLINKKLDILLGEKFLLPKEVRNLMACETFAFSIISSINKEIYMVTYAFLK